MCEQAHKAARAGMGVEFRCLSGENARRRLLIDNDIEDATSGRYPIVDLRRSRWSATFEPVTIVPR